MKIGFVTPWFGMNIPGGAEAELRGLLLHLKDTVDVEILTTCVEKFNSDWNVNFHPEGESIEGGICVRRFPVRERDQKAFDAVNYKLMNNMIPLSEEEEQTYVREMINSPALYSYIRQEKENFDLFVFIPYMFGTTYYGMRECSDKAVLIPCLHDESYIYLNVFKDLFKDISGMIFHANPEMELANRVYDLSKVNAQVLGEGVFTDLEGDAMAFRLKYQIEEPFILYAGRKDAGKKVDILLSYFSEYKKRNQSELKLVLIGGGEIDIPSAIREDVYDLGFVSIQDKYDAYAAAEFLCQPSTHESFSLVIMESWLSKRPVLVSGKCEVTKDFVIQSNGGLYFEDYFEFEGAVNYFVDNRGVASEMGQNGRMFVMDNFAWDVIVDKYTEYFRSLVRMTE